MLLFGERASEFKRFGDSFERGLGCACTGKHNRAVVEQAPEQALIDTYAFDAFEIYLYRPAADEPALGDDPAVCDCHFGGDIAKENKEQQQEADVYEAQDQAEQDAGQQAPYAEFRCVDDAFASRKAVLYVAQLVPLALQQKTKVW